MRASSTLKMAARRTPDPTRATAVEVPLPLVGASDVARRARQALALAAARARRCCCWPKPDCARTPSRPSAPQTRPAAPVVASTAEPLNRGDGRTPVRAPRRRPTPRDLEALGRGSAILEAAGHAVSSTTSTSFRLPRSAASRGCCATAKLTSRRGSTVAPAVPAGGLDDAGYRDRGARGTIPGGSAAGDLPPAGSPFRRCGSARPTCRSHRPLAAGAGGPARVYAAGVTVLPPFPGRRTSTSCRPFSPR